MDKKSIRGISDGKNYLELIEEEELIRNDRTLKLKHEELDVNCFWIEIKKEYPT